MFNPRTFENSRPDGFPVLEIVDDGLGDRSRTEPARLFVPLQRTELIGEVAGPVAALFLSQRFRFSASQFPKPIEAVYRFPLPGDAAVTGVRVHFGEVEITAELAERKQAEQTYQAARDEGRQAALVTREAPDVFTLQVAGIKPDEDVTIRTSYAQLCRPEGEGWSLRVPLTTVPRFVRSDETGSRHASGQPLAVLRDPGHRFTLDLTVDAAEGAASPTHSLSVDATEGRLRIRLRDGEVLPDRDCVLTWQPRRQADRPMLQIVRHDEPSTTGSHFLALVVPPATAEPIQTVPREVILLIDHSGSMSGPKWEAADWAVQNLLAGLSAADTFNLGLFHSTTRWFARQPVRGDERTTRQARDFLLRHTDSGGTELGVALEQALGQARDSAGRARHVVIVTDAQVSDAGRIMALVEREAGLSDRRRIDVLCIDAAPNSGLANEVAERGGGIARFLTSDPAENDIASALDEVLADWAAPILRNLTLQVDRPGVQAAGRRVSPVEGDQSAIDLGDLPAGRAVWVAGRVGDGAASRASSPPTFRLLADGQEIAAESPATDATIASYPAVASLFGARRVLDVELAQSSGVEVEERLRQLGYDPREVLAGPGSADAAPIYAENARQRSTDALHDLLVRESLRYGIACSATAFVATRHEAGERVAGTVAVASALAHGWSDDFLMMRSMSAGAAMPMAAPAFMPAPMASPPPAPGSAAPEQFFALRESPMASPGGGVDLGAVVSKPLDVARGAVRRLRERGRARRDESAAGSGSGAPADAVEEIATGRHDGLAIVFTGTPRPDGGEAVLFDSLTSQASLPGASTLTRLVVRIGGDVPAASIDAGLALALYVDDLTAPRARVRLADLIRQGGERPLNVRRQPGQVVRIVLLDPNGAWAAGAPSLEVALG